MAAQEIRVVRKQLIMDLDKNEAPVGWRWRVDRVIKFDDGPEKIVPDEIPATSSEVETHIGAAVLAQAADIDADRAERDAVKAERDAALVEHSKKEATLREAKALIAAALGE